MIAWFYRSVIKPMVRTVTPRWVWQAYGNILWYRCVMYPKDAATAARIGWPKFLYLQFWRTRAFASTGVRKIRLHGFRYPIFFRAGTSDPDVIRQVLADCEYECVRNETDVEYIIDCGANVGLTTFYLLHQYPAARAVVVEPDAGNMQMCRRNLAKFADRVTFVSAGVWSSRGPLVVERGGYRDGREWSTQVRPANVNEPADIQAVTVTDLLAAGDFPRVDILKMDIESAEADVFAGPVEWLERTRLLVIELHGTECERIVNQAVSGQLNFSETSGELTIYRNSSVDVVVPGAVA